MFFDILDNAIIETNNTPKKKLNSISIIADDVNIRHQCWLANEIIDIVTKKIIRCLYRRIMCYFSEIGLTKSLEKISVFQTGRSKV